MNYDLSLSRQMFLYYCYLEADLPLIASAIFKQGFEAADAVNACLTDLQERACCT
jgi:hypothetical protein